MGKKILSAMVLTLAFAQFALAATVDTGYIVDGVDNMTGVKMLHGQMVTLWTTTGTLKMLNSVTMSNGTKVMPSGLVTLANGTTFWMQEDAFMNFNGELTGGLVAQPTATYTTVSTTAGLPGVRRIMQSLNVRSSAAVLSTNIIGHLNAGTTVNVEKKSASGYWCKVSYKNYPNAWVACKYLSL